MLNASLPVDAVLNIILLLLSVSAHAMYLPKRVRFEDTPVASNPDFPQVPPDIENLQFEAGDLMTVGAINDLLADPAGIPEPPKVAQPATSVSEEMRELLGSLFENEDIDPKQTAEEFSFPSLPRESLEELQRTPQLPSIIENSLNAGELNVASTPLNQPLPYQQTQAGAAVALPPVQILSSVPPIQPVSPQIGAPIVSSVLSHIAYTPDVANPPQPPLNGPSATELLQMSAAEQKEMVKLLAEGKLDPLEWKIIDTPPLPDATAVPARKNYISNNNIIGSLNAILPQQHSVATFPSYAQQSQQQIIGQADLLNRISLPAQRSADGAAAVVDMSQIKTTAQQMQLARQISAGLVDPLTLITTETPPSTPHANALPLDWSVTANDAAPDGSSSGSGPVAVPTGLSSLQGSPRAAQIINNERKESKDSRSSFILPFGIQLRPAAVTAPPKELDDNNQPGSAISNNADALQFYRVAKTKQRRGHRPTGVEKHQQRKPKGEPVKAVISQQQITQPSIDTEKSAVLTALQLIQRFSHMPGKEAIVQAMHACLREKHSQLIMTHLVRFLPVEQRTEQLLKHVAAEEFNEISEALIANGADIQVNNNQPIRQAVTYENTGILRALVRNGADLQLGLQLACQRNLVDSVKILLTMRERVGRDSQLGVLINEAAASSKTQILELLLMSAPPQLKCEALNYSINFGRFESVSTVLQFDCSECDLNAAYVSATALGYSRIADLLSAQLLKL